MYDVVVVLKACLYVVWNNRLKRHLTIRCLRIKLCIIQTVGLAASVNGFKLWFMNLQDEVLL